MKSKTELTGRPVAELMAGGQAEIGMQQIVAILPVAGAELVGPLPSELQNVIVYAAGSQRLPKMAPKQRIASTLCAAPQQCSSFAPKVWSRADGLPFDVADVLAPSHFRAHLGLTWDGGADTYRPLYGRR